MRGLRKLQTTTSDLRHLQSQSKADDVVQPDSRRPLRVAIKGTICQARGEEGRHSYASRYGIEQRAAELRNALFSFIVTIGKLIQSKHLP